MASTSDELTAKERVQLVAKSVDRAKTAVSDTIEDSKMAAERLLKRGRYAVEDTVEQRKREEAQRKKELRSARSSQHNDGFYTIPVTNSTPTPPAGALNSTPTAPEANKTQEIIVSPSSPYSAAKTPAAAPVAPAAPVTPTAPPVQGKDNGFFYDNPAPK